MSSNNLANWSKIVFILILKEFLCMLTVVYYKAVEYWNSNSKVLQALVDSSVEEMEEAVQTQEDPPLPNIKKDQPVKDQNCDRLKESETQIKSSEEQSSLIPVSHTKSRREAVGDQSYQLIVSTPSLELAGVVDSNIGNLKSQNEAVVIGNQGQTLLLQDRSLEEWRQVPNDAKDQPSIMLLPDVKPKQEQTSLLRDIRRDQQSLLLGRRADQVLVSTSDKKSEQQHSLLHHEKKPEQQSLLLQRPPPVLADKENHGEENTLNLKDQEVLEEDEYVRSNLSGHVVIVGEEGQQEITVTGQDGLRHRVHIHVEEEDEGSHSEDEQEITSAMASVECVTIDGNPAPVDESVHRVARSRPDGAYEVVYQCELCGKAHVTAAGLTSHRWQHTKPFQCERCKQRFASKGNLVIHRRRHTGEKPFGCHLCNSRFSTKGNLKRHVQTHSGVKPWACDQCEGRFTEKKSLKIHMRKHTGERPYTCTVCGKSFAQTSILRSHLAMHMDKRAHLCDLCGRSFRQKSQLRLHVQRHSGMKKFDCIYCESKFLTKGDLERHVKSHMGTRDFTCDLCHKTFTRQQTLNEHMNRHYGLKPYECKVCGKAFSEMSTVYKHIKTHDQQKRSEVGSIDEQVIVRKLPNNVHLCDIVNPNVSDSLGDETIEEGLTIEPGVKEEKMKDDEEQFIYLETTGMDGSISITEATVDQEGNLRIGPEGL